MPVVIATTKVRIFKQITTIPNASLIALQLLLLPQRYVFSSKSQLRRKPTSNQSVVIATTKVRIFKQITTLPQSFALLPGCYCYHKGTYFQANHNRLLCGLICERVVIATTKVRIFKQITTVLFHNLICLMLLLLPQRYVFSSKSQPFDVDKITTGSCYCYHKGTYFQANHNSILSAPKGNVVVIATTKVRIFKQITTG